MSFCRGGRLWPVWNTMSLPAVTGFGFDMLIAPTPLRFLGDCVASVVRHAIGVL